MAGTYTPKNAAIDEKGIALALQAASMGSWHWDIIKDKRYIDHQGCKLLGLDPTTFGGTGAEFIATIHPEDRSGIKAAIERTLKEDAPYRVAYRTVWPDGSVHSITARAGLERDAAGHPQTMSGIFWDSTELERNEAALRENEAALQAVLQSTSNGILAVGLHDEVLFANSKFAALWRIPQELIKSGDDTKILSFVLDQLVDPDEFLRKVKRQYSSMEESFEVLRFKDGRIFERFSHPLLRDGMLVGTVWSFLDVTERKKAEMQTQEALELLRESQGIARLGSYVLDVTTGIWRSSKVLDAVFGISVDYDHTVEGWTAIIHPEDREMMTRYFSEEVVGKGEPFDKQYRIIRQNDRVIRWVHGLGQLRKDAKGAVVEMHGTIQDITESIEARLELERAKSDATNAVETLKAQKSRLDLAIAKDEAILTSIGDGMVVTDIRGTITMVNKMFEQMTDWTADEVVGKLLTDVLPITESDGKEVPVKNRLITQRLVGSSAFGSKDNRHFIVRKGGTRFPAALTVTPVLLGGALIGAVEVIRDITKEKELERAKDEFISIASHQLRTPVSALRWVTEALQHSSQNMDEKQRVYLTDLAESTQRLVDLVEGLLDVSRIQMKSPLLLERSSVEISPFVQRVVTEMEGYARAKDHTLAFSDRTNGTLLLNVNTKSLYNVLQNFISNAIEYSPDKTEVTVMLEKVDSGIKVAVANTGQPIAEEDKPHIFERFYRGEWARKVKIAGTGLGLYIAKLLIEEMGGSIGFESDADNGTVFWLTLRTPTV